MLNKKNEDGTITKYYVIKGEDTRVEEAMFKGYVTALEEHNGQKVVGFSSSINYRAVKKYKTKKRCEMMLKKLEEETKHYKYEIEELENLQEE